MISHSSPSLDEADFDAVMSCLRSGMIAEGGLTSSLERLLVDEFGFHTALAVGSGSQALLLALRAAAIRSGSRVLLPTYVCPEVLGVIEALGALPVLTDVGSDYLMDPGDPAFDDPLGHDAVVIPSMFGHAVSGSCYRQRSAAPLIADWAQYLPAQRSHDHNGFDMAVLSFEATKLFAGGEGGAVLARRESDALELVKFKQVAGTPFKLNLYPLSNIQSALIASQIAKRGQFTERRRSISDFYDDALAGVSGIVRTSSVRSGASFRYVVQIVKDAALSDIVSAFEKRGVSVRRPVSVMLHHLRPASRNFPKAEELFSRTISLPIYPSLSDAQVRHVAAVAWDILS